MASLAQEPLLTLPTARRSSRLRGRRLRALVVAVGDVLAALTAILLVLEADLVDGPVTVATVVGMPAAWVLCVGARRGYEERLLRGWQDEVEGVVGAGLVLTVAAVVVAAFGNIAVTPEGFLLLVTGTVGLSLAPRAAVRVVRRHRRARAQHGQRVVVVGNRDDVDPLVAELRRFPSPGLVVVGASPDSLAAELDERTAAVVAVPCAELDPPALRRMGWELERTGTELFVTAGLLDVARTRAAVVTPGNLPLVHVRRSELTGVRRLVKDVAERLATLVGLILLAPLMLAIAIAVRLDSPGPAFYRQTRVGRDGEAFTMVKFRTMHVGADQLLAELADHNEADAVLFKMRSDPRVTRIGGVLRTWSLDELPQLFNVLLGQMSLVGPRPPLPAEAMLYESDVNRRFAVKPGVTGLWQVSGRSDLTWEESVRLDLRYVDNWSLSSDLRILLRTVRAVLRRDGAY